MLQNVNYNGDNMPIQAPFYKSPNNPQFCKDLKTISVYCRTKPEIIKKYLEPTPFEYVTDQFVISVGDYSNGTAASFYDAGIIVPVRYKNVVGGYFLFEYEDLASSISGGRELWGYPKKAGEFSWKEDDGRIEVGVARENHEIIHISLDMCAGAASELPNLTIYPHLLLWTMPKYGGPGIQCQKLLARDTSMDFALKTKKEAAAHVTLSGYEHFPIIEPLDELCPVEIYGARYTVGDYACTEQNGWASLVDVIIPDPDF